MYVVRPQVFETNSSSMHSLVVLKESDYVTDFEKKCALSNYGTELRLGPEVEFGQSYEVITDFKMKLAYAFASLTPAHVDKLLEAVHEILPTLTLIRAHSYWDEKDIHFKLVDGEFMVEEYDSVGYIDHQSCYLLQEFLADKDLDIKEFLTNKKYVIVVDSDCSNREWQNGDFGYRPEDIEEVFDGY